MATERLQRRIDRLLDQIEEVADAEDWERVSRLCQEVMYLDPENVEAKTYLGMSEQFMGSTTAPVETSSQPEAVGEQPAKVATDETPTSFANGRYTVSRFLGEGGKKRVYLAQDTLLDRDVAFALIKTEGLDDVSRTRISREAQAMGRLGSHPHIVTVFDLGDHEGQPFMVTELMGGGDVEAIIEDAPEHRLPLEQAIRIAVETCRGLEFAHSRGIIHRDLKPGNVWLTEDGTAKIGDFGLAVATDRSRLTQEGMMVGTVSYMPPEQAMGGETTAQADLYSLGAMLYEMVAGRPPFLGDDSVAIIGQHINTPPVAPAWHRPECPKPLEALILRLLAKNPTERPESASDVLTALQGIDLSITPATNDSDEREANALDSLAGGVFVGRHAEMGELKAALEDALSGRGRMVTLVGEPGIGKTRTAQELVTYANLRGAQVLWGRCYEEQGVPPYWPWVQAIRSYVTEREPEELASVMGAGAADIAEIVSDVKQRLPGLQPPPQLDSPEQARFRLFDSITSFLKNASRVQPIMLVLDDLHWADKPSLMLLQFVTRELSSARLLIMGTYRDMELNRQHPLAETLGDLTRERQFQRVLLRGLSQDDVGRFIETTSGINPPAGLVQAVHTQTEGNPLFVTEVVRLLVQEGELTADSVGERESWTVRIPEGVREVIGRRLNQLSRRCNETLTMASVIGREFELGQLDRLVEDQTEDMLLDVLEEGLNARVIGELPSTVGRYQFTHALIQETLVNELSLTRRVRLHARIAEMLEELYGDGAEAHAAELAHHFAQAESMLGSGKLVQYSIKAGERALAAFAWEEALSLFERAWAAKEGQPMDLVSADILFGLGRAQAATLPEAHLHEAEVNFRRAFDYYVNVKNVSMAVEVAAYPILTIPGFTNVAPLIGSALNLVASDSYEAGRLLSRYIRALGAEQGDLAGAQEAATHALGIAQSNNDVALEMRILTESATVNSYHFQWHEALDTSLQAIKLAQDIDEPRAEGLAHQWAGFAHHCLGTLDEAKLHFQASYALAEQLRDKSRVGTTLFFNGAISQSEGNWQDARSFMDRGLMATPGLIYSLTNLALLEYEVGQFAKGENYLERSLESMRLSPKGPNWAHAFPAATLPMIWHITRVTNHIEVAKAAAGTVLSYLNAPPMAAILARTGLALLAVEQHDKVEASEHYNFLRSLKGVFFFFFAGDRILGLLAHTSGDFQDAQTHFEEALVFCRKAGYRPELAWSLCDYADMLLERKSDGDREKAMQHLDESLQISTELGMRPLMERVLSRREILKA